MIVSENSLSSGIKGEFHTRSEKYQRSTPWARRTACSRSRRPDTGINIHSPLIQRSAATRTPAATAATLFPRCAAIVGTAAARELVVVAGAPPEVDAAVPDAEGLDETGSPLPASYLLGSRVPHLFLISVVHLLCACESPMFLAMQSLNDCSQRSCHGCQQHESRETVAGFRVDRVQQEHAPWASTGGSTEGQARNRSGRCRRTSSHSANYMSAGHILPLRKRRGGRTGVQLFSSQLPPQRMPQVLNSALHHSAGLNR